MSEIRFTVGGKEIAASGPFNVAAAIATQLREALPDIPVYEGTIVEDDGPARLAEAMVESTTEFDFAPGREWSLPDDLRERLVQWCADLRTWDRERGASQ